MKPIAEAAAELLATFAPLPAERVSLDAARGRFLAAPLAARVDEPAFDNSAMDGWAVRSEDVAAASEASPVALDVVGESRAGVPAAAALGAGEAIRIFTGAKLPEGADAVVMQEDATREGERVSIREAAALGRHVRRRGEVLAAGATMLEAGARFDAGEIGVAASQGHALVPVHRAPRVAILSTGDELRELGDPRPAEGSLIDSSAHALAAAVREAGGVPVLQPRGPDDPDALAASLERALGCDVVITTGGVSVGEYDFLRGAFDAAGVEELFWKARIKPGKPIWAGRGPSGAPVVGLPGNPVSALVTFEVFVRPGVRTLIGDPRPHRRLVRVPLARPMRAPGTRTELARAKLVDGVAHPASQQGSAAMTSMIGLDLLLVLPMGAGEISEADALDLRHERGAALSPWEAVAL